MIVISDILAVERYVTGLDVVLFDLDDTLYSEKEYVRSGFHQVSALFPEISDAEETLWSYFLLKQPAIDRFLEKEHLSQQLKEKCVEAYRLQSPDIHMYPKVRDMLMRLKLKCHLGLVTDGRPEGQRAKIRALGLEDIFEHIIITDELGGSSFRKPNPKAFQMMAEHFSVEYAKMCYVGDNMQKDVTGPESLGMVAILFRNNDGLYLI